MFNKFFSKTSRLLWVVAGLFVFMSGARAENIDNLAQALIRIRSEVEELQSQLDMEKQDHKSKMDALGSQMADLGVESRRQELTLEKLQQSLDKLKEASEAAQSGDESLIPVIIASLDQLALQIEEGLPFKLEDRLHEVESLKSQVENRVIDPKRAANRIWALIEDEIRLSRENGVYTQTIELDGQKRLADVAKLGSILLYFQTSDNRSGMVRKENNRWRYVEVTNTADKERIAMLFDALKKQIRQGYFELPNPLGS